MVIRLIEEGLVDSNNFYQMVDEFLATSLDYLKETVGAHFIYGCYRR